MIAEVVARIAQISGDVLGRMVGRKRRTQHSGSDLSERLTVAGIAQTTRHVELAAQMPGEIAKRRVFPKHRRSGVREQVVHRRIAGQIVGSELLAQSGVLVVVKSTE